MMFNRITCHPCMSFGTPSPACTFRTSTFSCSRSDRLISSLSGKSLYVTQSASYRSSRRNCQRYSARKTLNESVCKILSSMNAATNDVTWRHSSSNLQTARIIECRATSSKDRPNLSTGLTSKHFLRCRGK